MTPTLYLFFDGTCEQAMRFYADVFGGEVGDIMRNGDMPDPDSRMPGGDDLVMHMNIRIGGVTIMASDAPEGGHNKPQGFDIHMECDSLPEAERVFATLSEGGEVKMPLEPMFWAERFGALVDRWGVPWMISYSGDAMPG